MLTSARQGVVVSAIIAGCWIASSSCSSGTKGGTPGLGNGSSSGDAGGSSSSSSSSGGAGSSSSSSSSGGIDFDGGGGADEGTTTVVDKIYASTDTALYVMNDPTMPSNVSLIGSFSGNGSSGITDVAVDGAGDVFVNTTTVLYKAAIPASGTGTVNLTQLATIGTGSNKFYALAFTPSGLLEPGIESLVAGDGNGHLWLIPNATTSSSPTPVDLGDFGAFGASDPLPSDFHSGDTKGDWGLSGDLVFWTDSMGTVHGVATLRLAVSYTSSGTVTNTFDTGDDILAEIDIAALQTKSSTANLRKGFYGTGSGFGKVFGVGAWGDKVYGFTLYTAASSKASGNPAQLISIDSTGVGVHISDFASITDGWTGAGVSTKASVTIPPVIH